MDDLKRTRNFGSVLAPLIRTVACSGRLSVPFTRMTSVEPVALSTFQSMKAPSFRVRSFWKVSVPTVLVVPPEIRAPDAMMGR